MEGLQEDLPLLRAHPHVVRYLTLLATTPPRGLLLPFFFPSLLSFFVLRSSTLGGFSQL
jgi:hypothetical protein